MSFLLPSSIPPARAPKPLSPASKVVGWKGRQGASWATRNPATVEALDANYVARFGAARTEVNRQMLARVPRSARVLEVGCSAGRQLDALARIGFHHLEGVDVSPDAVAQCKWPSQVTDGRALPFDDGSFDLVMTSGTLMHVPPEDRAAFIAETQRVARRWIYGCELWSAQDSLWDFGDLIPPAWTCDWYRTLPSSGWALVERTHLNNLHDKNALAVYLLERTP